MIEAETDREPDFLRKFYTLSYLSSIAVGRLKIIIQKDNDTYDLLDNYTANEDVT